MQVSNFDLYIHCTDTNDCYNNPGNLMDWGNMNDHDVALEVYDGQVLTKELITALINLPNSSSLTEAERLNYLQRNEGRYIWFYYT